MRSELLRTYTSDQPRPRDPSSSSYSKSSSSFDKRGRSPSPSDSYSKKYPLILSPRHSALPEPEPTRRLSRRGRSPARGSSPTRRFSRSPLRRRPHSINSRRSLRKEPFYIDRDQSPTPTRRSSKRVKSPSPASKRYATATIGDERSLPRCRSRRNCSLSPDEFAGRVEVSDEARPLRRTSAQSEFNSRQGPRRNSDRIERLTSVSGIESVQASLMKIVNSVKGEDDHTEHETAPASSTAKEEPLEKPLPPPASLPRPPEPYRSSSPRGPLGPGASVSSAPPLPPQCLPRTDAAGTDLLNPTPAVALLPLTSPVTASRTAQFGPASTSTITLSLPPDAETYCSTIPSSSNHSLNVPSASDQSNPSDMQGSAAPEWELAPKPASLPEARPPRWVPISLKRPQADKPKPIVSETEDETETDVDMFKSAGNSFNDKILQRSQAEKDLIAKLTRELWDSRRNLMALSARGLAIEDSLRDMKKQEEKSKKPDRGFMEACEELGVGSKKIGSWELQFKIKIVESLLREETRARVKADMLLADVLRECEEPKVVPQLYELLLGASQNDLPV
ncbi:hypothetical protein AAF712_010199 [Marasmius tenuissimus]|uniref:Uncharacterized protein n=1 Tax=Marasmius tenuissimus TaxID=585030 RepID=A0ABR2ZPD8_9AGAR